MAVIAEALGHADERITRRHYAHLAPSYVATTIRAGAAGLKIVDEKPNITRFALQKRAVAHVD
jgi:prephenate dehydratase